MDVPPHDDGNPPFAIATSPIALPNPLGLALGGNLLFHPQALAAANMGALYPSAAALQTHALLSNPHLASMGLLGLPTGLEIPYPNFAPVPLPMAPLVPQAMPNVPSYMSSMESLLRAAEKDPSNTGGSDLNFETPPARSSQPPRVESVFKPVPRQSKLRQELMEEEDDLEEESDDLSVSVSKDAESDASDAESSDAYLEDASSSGKGYGTRSKSRRAKSAGTASTRSKRGASASTTIESDQPTRMKLRPRAAASANGGIWDKLELPLPSISVPVSSGTQLPKPKSVQESSLEEVNNQAPVLALIDAPSIWRASAAPLHTEYLQRVLLPAFSAKYDAKFSNPTPIRPISRISLQSSSYGSDTAFAPSLSANATTKARKKRQRDGETADNVGREDFSNMDSAFEPPTTKRPKHREKSDGGGVNDADGLEEDVEEHTKLISAKRRRKSEVSEIKRDSDGNPILPLRFGSLEVVALGRVMVGNERFWSRRYIFPVGYIARRPYYSVKSPETKCYYIQELLASETEPVSPIFKLTCEDEPERPIFGSSASSVWATLLDRIRPQREQIMGRPLNSSISGPEQYGFSHPSIHSLIEALPGASECLGHDPMSLYEKKTLKEG